MTDRHLPDGDESLQTSLAIHDADAPSRKVFDHLVQHNRRLVAERNEKHLSLLELVGVATRLADVTRKYGPTPCAGECEHDSCRALADLEELVQL